MDHHIWSSAAVAGPKEQSLSDDRKASAGGQILKFDRFSSLSSKKKRFSSLSQTQSDLFRDSEGWPLALAGASAAGLLGIAGGHALALVRLPACTSVLWSFRVGDQL